MVPDRPRRATGSLSPGEQACEGEDMALLSAFSAPSDAVRRSVRAQVERTLSGPRASARHGGRARADWESTFGAPIGDPGLFGPGSVTWQVHSDLPAMLVGGVAALLLQALHPLAMAGVAEHSAYRTDPLGRLRRTATFVGTTTFGNTAAAERAIDSVRRVHSRVHGVAPDGRPYDANDPELLTWVQTAEAWCFVRAYRRFGPRPLAGADVDRYLAEMAVVALRLGARWLPTTRLQVDRYFDAVRPQLVGGAQALSAAAFIVNSGGQSLPQAAGATVVSQALLVQAAIGLLPRWAGAMLRLRRPIAAERLVQGAAADAMLLGLRWAIGPSPALQLAQRRCAAALPVNRAGRQGPGSGFEGPRSGQRPRSAVGTVGS